MRVIDEFRSEESKMAKKKKRQIAPMKLAGGENDISRKLSTDDQIETAPDDVGLISTNVSVAQMNGIEEPESLYVSVASSENPITFSPKKCNHLKSGINPSTVRKKLKQFSRRCEECDKINGSDENDVVWICLCCGHRGCGRYSTNQHALKHFDTVRSVQHSLVFNLLTSQVWCYNCDNEIPADATSQLKQVLLNIQSSLVMVGPDTPKPLSETPKSRFSASENSSKSKSTKDKSDKNENIPDSVKGLSNLGNTCFFNSVVQNLLQTQQLDDILDAGRLVKGANVVIKPSTNANDQLSNSSDSTSDEQKNKEIFYPPVTVTLNDDLGPLTQSLCSIFKEFKTGKSSVITPNSLFGHVCKKAPRFKGFQQQDSHELLRYLLDAVRDEEQRRLRLALLATFKLAKNLRPESLPQAEKQKVKAYDRAADVTCVEQVFGGQLLQCITCLDCKNVSRRQESFLDLSLPIADNKDSTAAVVVEKLADNDFLSSLETPKKYGKSKHILKKEKKVAKKVAKGHLPGGRRRLSSETVIPLIDETPMDEESSEVKKIEPSSTAEDSTNGLACADGLTYGTDSSVDDAVSSTDGIVAQMDNCSLDEAPIEDGDELKCEEDETFVDAQEKPPSSEIQASNKFMEPLNTQDESKYSSTCNLSACLREFMSSEKLTGKNKFGCEFCSKVQFSETNADLVANDNITNKPKIKLVYTEALKQYIIFSPPAVLTLHLKRFHQVGGSFRKISKHVEFPAILDLSPYCSKESRRVSPNCDRVRYSLYGVVSHSGRLSGGHYVAYVKIREKTKNDFTSTFLQSGPAMTVASTAADVDCNKNNILTSTTAKLTNSPVDYQPPSSGRWYYISDSHVSESTEQKVLSSEAYLLFYERFQ